MDRGSRQTQPLKEGLRDEEAVEGISMVAGQGVSAQRAVKIEGKIHLSRCRRKEESGKSRAKKTAGTGRKELEDFVRNVMLGSKQIGNYSP